MPEAVNSSLLPSEIFCVSAICSETYCGVPDPPRFRNASRMGLIHFVNSAWRCFVILALKFFVQGESASKAIPPFNNAP
jgi:hypothetical protein